MGYIYPFCLDPISMLMKHIIFRFLDCMSGNLMLKPGAFNLFPHVTGKGVSTSKHCL